MTPFKSPLKLFGLKRNAPDRRLKRQISEHVVIQESEDALDDDTAGMRLDGEEGEEITVAEVIVRYILIYMML